MIINNKKRAYSLSEIMVVMLVLSIIFAAIAPFFTKRRVNANKSKYAVWELADKSSFDAYTVTNSPEDNGEVFLGLKPSTQDEVESLFSPLAKLVIRSGPVTAANVVQRQIQFRYGYHSDYPYGKFAGSWLMDGRNALLGGSYTNIDLTETPAVQNTALGFRALTNIKTGRGNTAVGYNALQAITDTNYNTAIGSHAGYNSSADAKNNTFIGALAGFKNSGYSNTAIGYNTMGYNSNPTGYYNTLIGVGSGKEITTGYNNLAIGYNALNKITTGHDNIAAGYNALKNLTTGSYNVAIGYNACAEVTTGSQITCIGANSGPHTGNFTELYPNKKLGYLSSAEAYLNATVDNNTPRTYIGSKPTNFGGDAVLEIHNVPDLSNTEGKIHGISYHFGGTSSNVTTVVNGNLIVRGRPYFTSGQRLYHVHDANYFKKNDSTKRFLGYTKTNIDVVTCAADPTNYNFYGASCVRWPESTTSDRRLKNIGSKFTDGLDKLSKVNIYNFTFKNDKKKNPRVGVIAQELQKIFPNAVSKGADGYLRIRWDELFYAAINAVKELDNKLIALVNRVTKLGPQITELEEENLVLKSQVDQLTQRVENLKRNKI